MSHITLDYKKIKKAAQGYKADMTAFMRDLILRYGGS